MLTIKNVSYRRVNLSATEERFVTLPSNQHNDEWQLTNRTVALTVSGEWAHIRGYRTIVRDREAARNRAFLCYDLGLHQDEDGSWRGSVRVV